MNFTCISQVAHLSFIHAISSSQKRMPDVVLRSQLNELHALAFVTPQHCEGGLYVAAGALDGSVVLWNVTTARVMCEWFAHGGGVIALIQGDRGELWSQGRDGTVVEWHWGTEALSVPPKRVRTLQAGFGSFCRIALARSLNTRFLVAPGLDGSRMQLWAVPTPTASQTDTLDDAPTTMGSARLLCAVSVPAAALEAAAVAAVARTEGFATDGVTAKLAGNCGMVMATQLILPGELISTHAGGIARELKDARLAGPGTIADTALLLLVATYENGWLYVLDPNVRRQIGTNFASDCIAVQLHAESQAEEDAPRTLETLMDGNAADVKLVLSIELARDAVLAFALSDDVTVGVAGTSAGDLIFFSLDINSGKGTVASALRTSLPGVSAMARIPTVRGVFEARDPPQIALAGGWDGAVRILDLRKRTQLACLHWHIESVYAVAAALGSRDDGAFEVGVNDVYGSKSTMHSDAVMFRDGAVTIATAGKKGRVALWGVHDDWRTHISDKT